MENMEEIRRDFKNPPVWFRSIPFWAWNDRLDEDDLVRQVEDMKQQGFGGFFIHSREGLETEYMGKQWLHCVRRVVQTAKELGMEAWLYDEDRWPSGTAGGKVPSKSADFRAKGLTLELTNVPVQPDPRIFACYRARINPDDPMELSEFTALTANDYACPGTDEVILVFRVETASPCEWFNNQAPPDNLSPDTVKEFIQCTHEVYNGAVGNEFGAAIPGIFSDEPGIHDRNCTFTPGRGWIPWTQRFADVFRERRGWNICELLPFLFFNGDASPHVRHDYWRTITELFSESFTGQISNWCESHHLELTGHFLWENKLGVATRVCGAVMPNYRYEHIPGIDLLSEQIDECITVKQCSSVANQYGKNQVVAETYGCTGWDFNFEGQKWIGDWMYVLGVTRRCQHLVLSSLRGCRKRDYPPSFNYHTPQWKYSHIVEDYFARIASVLTRGKAIRDVLVIHPSSTAWCRLGSNPYGFKKRGQDRDIPEIDRYGDQFDLFLKRLLAEHYDFDLGDETIIAETGRVDGKAFCVNHAHYRIVILPRTESLLSSTVSILTRFLDSDGVVLAVGPMPDKVEGLESKAPQALAAFPSLTLLNNESEVLPTLEHLLPRRVDIRGEFNQPVPQLLYMLRDFGKHRALFVVNTDRNRLYDVSISLNFAGSVEEWEPLTGTTAPVETERQQGGIRISAHFGPAGSRLFVIDENAGTDDNLLSLRRENPENEEFIAALGPSCTFTRTAPNVLTLDFCRWKIEDGTWSENMEVWQAQKAIRDFLSMRPVHLNGIPQRYKWIGQPHPKDGTPVSFAFQFFVQKIPNEIVKLVLEKPEDFIITLNGKPVENRLDGWFLDRSFCTIPLPKFKQGRNELILSCRYCNRMEAENIYLNGDFGVDAERRIISERKLIHFGDWCFQGYFHYCGGIIYHFNVTCEKHAGDRIVLRPGTYSAVMLEVSVNGASAGCIPWSSVEQLDITDFIRNGENKIDIEVTGSARNMLGPFHQAQGKLKTTDCACFTREGNQCTTGYTVHSYGLFGQIGIFRIS